MAGSKDTGDEFRHLGMFITTALLGFLIWSLIITPMVYFLVKRTNPFRFLLSLLEPVLIVFATCSSAIAMPETLHSLEITNKLDKRITRFVVPLSSSIGRSGTCLYINVSCLFVIQLVGLELTVTRIALVWDRFRSITNLFDHAMCVVVTCEFSQSVLTEHGDEATTDLNPFDTEIMI